MSSLQQLIVTTADELNDLAAIISSIEKERLDGAAVLRICALAHAKVSEILGEHSHIVYDETEDPDDAPLLNLSVAGYVSAEES
jgi:hypothetical protein